MKMFILLNLIIFMFLVTVSSFADTNSEEIKNQIQVLIEESRNSPDWVFIAQTDQGFVGFMGKDRFVIQGNNRRAWTKVFIKNGMTIKNNKDQDKILMYVLDHRIYDCLDGKISDMKSIKYYSDGTSDSTDFASFYKVYPEKRWTDTVPGTLGDIPLKFVCSYNPS